MVICPNCLTKTRSKYETHCKQCDKRSPLIATCKNMKPVAFALHKAGYSIKYASLEIYKCLIKNELTDILDETQHYTIRGQIAFNKHFTLDVFPNLPNDWQLVIDNFILYEECKLSYVELSVYDDYVYSQRHKHIQAIVNELLEYVQEELAPYSPIWRLAGLM